MTDLPKDPSTTKKDKSTNQENIAAAGPIHIQQIDQEFKFYFISFKRILIVIRYFDDM